MANSNSPYRRIGANSWQELIDKVNDELQDPPDGCSPIEPIDLPDDCHRWAKSDIREVHDKLNEMPGDCFDFQEIPDLWKVSIIEDIEDQLEDSWCECETCCEPCENAFSGILEIFLGSELEGDDCLTPCVDAPPCP